MTAAAIDGLTRNLPRLWALNLSGFSIEQDALRGLARLRALQELRLELCTVDGPDLTCLEQLPLISLELRYIGVTDTDLVSIGRITTLDDLNLGDSDVTDAGLAHLAGLSNLTSLNLSDCKQVDGSGLRVVTQLPQLRLLSLSGTKVTEEHVKVLSECSSLTMLGLPQHISAETVAELKAALPGCMVLQ